MRSITTLLLLFMLAGFAFAQNEQTEIVEKEFPYRNWKYKNVTTDGKTDLREFAKGRKLVMVVYWAPWCNNWKHDVAFVQQLHEKYKGQGLAVIGVSNYDSVDRMKNHIESYKLTFPNVYETESTADRLKSEHYTGRTAAGDKRKWGTPWYVFLEPGQIAAEGDTLATKMNVANGELIQDKAENFIRQKLGLGENKAAAVKTTAAIEACEAEKTSATLVKP